MGGVSWLGLAALGDSLREGHVIRHHVQLEYQKIDTLQRGTQLWQNQVQIHHRQASSHCLRTTTILQSHLTSHNLKAPLLSATLIHHLRAAR